MGFSRSKGLPRRHQVSLTEDADIGTSSAEYARRFTGAVGRWFLETQKRLTLSLLGALPAEASIIDVGGGHGQIAPALIEAGYQVTVVGSAAQCGHRLQPWIENGRCHFRVANLQALPYADASFDAAVCLRLLPHSIDWTKLIGELCRVAARSVIVDYPSRRSLNLLSGHLFNVKQGLELNTRRFITFWPQEIRSAFAAHHFVVQAEHPQFLLPMVVHRTMDQAALSRLLEVPGRALGLTRRFGSPIIARADREVDDFMPREVR